MIIQSESIKQWAISAIPPLRWKMRNASTLRSSITNKNASFWRRYLFLFHFIANNKFLSYLLRFFFLFFPYHSNETNFISPRRLWRKFLAIFYSSQFLSTTTIIIIFRLQRCCGCQFICFNIEIMILLSHQFILNNSLPSFSLNLTSFLCIIKRIILVSLTPFSQKHALFRIFSNEKQLF